MPLLTLLPTGVTRNVLESFCQVPEPEDELILRQHPGVTSTTVLLDLVPFMAIRQVISELRLLPALG